MAWASEEEDEEKCKGKYCVGREAEEGGWKEVNRRREHNVWLAGGKGELEKEESVAKATTYHNRVLCNQ